MENPNQGLLLTYLLSHAQREENVSDPGHTPEGFTRLAEMRKFLLDILPCTGRFFVPSGDGKRFRQVAQHACGDFGNHVEIVPYCTPFLGGSAADRADKSRDLACGDIIPADQWLGISSGLCDPWNLFARLGLEAVKRGCNVLLMCGGGEITSAITKSLGMKGKESPKAQGSVYVINTHPRSIVRIFDELPA